MVAPFACVSRRGVCLAWVTGLWILPIVLSLFNFIGNWLGYFLGLPQHCGLRENVPDLSKNSALHAAASDFGISVLAYELAYRASYVCWRALL